MKILNILMFPVFIFFWKKSLISCLHQMQKLKAVYTGCDKATAANHLYFVRHK